ncbi:acyl-CoA-binding protein-like [Thalassophryne amazonica]|uniref:acyl-CoA-binding protein-like n=1 Tax=Thalassophryne amazonica TaxID=390379 RepID=UPI001472240C|nr:acyl-CoA-binding protein-like [Thalassophryne amazonica]XP_034031571.1 acyl-CoA-binding protein-like [Thalassophryne amazonica]
MNESFSKAAKEAVRLKQMPDRGEMSELYGLYKQATCGNNTTEYPGFFDFKGKAKWDAWNSRKGLSREEAMNKYVDLVESLKNKYGLDSD